MICDAVKNMNVFYVYVIGIDPKYGNEEDRTGIIPTLLGGIIKKVNDLLYVLIVRKTIHIDYINNYIIIT